MLVLASSSPRRRDLLALTGIPFEVVPANADETIAPGLSPEETVRILARRKAEAVFALRPHDRILAADTLVFLDGKPLGKPVDQDDAKRMLHALSGRVHQVWTGFCLLDADGAVSGEECTGVEFYPLSENEVEAYIQTGEPMDKAGAYGIQGRGALFVRRISGDYYSVMGLPIARIARQSGLGQDAQTAVTAGQKDF